MIEDRRLGSGAVGKEFEQVAAAADVRDVVEIEAQRLALARAIFDEGAGVDAAIPARVEDARAEDGGAGVVACGDPVGEASEVAANVGVPFPRREETAEIAQLARNRIFDARALDIAVQLRPKAFPEAVERRIERQVGERLPAGSDIAGCVEPFRREDAVLEQADEIVAELEPRLALLEQRMLDREAALPAALRLQIGI